MLYVSAWYWLLLGISFLSSYTFIKCSYSSWKTTCLALLFWIKMYVCVEFSAKFLPMEVGGNFHLFSVPMTETDYLSCCSWVLCVPPRTVCEGRIFGSSRRGRQKSHPSDGNPFHQQKLYWVQIYPPLCGCIINTWCQLIT